MFLDASAIVAILAREPEADALADLVDRATAPITSPIAVFEASAGLSRIRRMGVEEALAAVRDFLALAKVECTDLTAADAETALTAYSRYGKGQGNPAQLNLGDCFAYAAAKNRGKSLLFKGEDFAKTDIRAAG